MIKSAIEWTETTWSPVIGCTKVSQGCKHCYAEREVDTRWSKNPKSVWFGRSFTDVLCRPDQLDVPLHWKKPRRIFVCPRADLFHEAVPDDFILSVFVTMAVARHHTFQVLTKRIGRARDLLTRWKQAGLMRCEGCDVMLHNVHIGTSIEDQATADERIPLLLQTPAAVRWISAEPLLGPVSLTRVALGEDAGEDIGGWKHCDAITQWVNCLSGEAYSAERTGSDLRGTEKSYILPSLDWLVVGGESGPDARPMHPQWVRDLRDQCAEADVPFLLKQWGEWFPARDLPGDTSMYGDRWANVDIRTGKFFTWGHGAGTPDPIHEEVMGRVGKTKAGRRLDGVLHDAYPEAKP